MKKPFSLLALVLILVLGIVFVYLRNNSKSVVSNMETDKPENNLEEGSGSSTNPLTIESLRKQTFPGSDLVIEQTLDKGSNYSRYVASYQSEGNKIFGLLTIPNGGKPQNGWPVIIFNHGYIPPQEYKTTEKYVAYQDAFAKAGYITFKSDYRGHGNSEGDPSGAYGANDYTIDVLNALSTLKKYKDADPNNMGMWGHSMGGFITLRSMVVSKDIKAGVIWAGVVGDYQDILENWRRPNNVPSSIPSSARRWRDVLLQQYGTPEQNPDFWNSISANHFLTDISGPVELHHGTADTSVPLEFSSKLEKQLREIGKTVQLYIYPGDDHNLSGNLSIALRRSVEFFDKYLKS